MKKHVLFPLFYRLTHSPGQVPTALAVDDDLNLVAIGFDNGTLILLRGDLRRDRGAKQKTLLTGGSSGLSGSIVGVSGLAFRASKLYAATSTEVLLFNVKDKDKESCHRLDDIGCEVGKFHFLTLSFGRLVFRDSFVVVVIVVRNFSHLLQKTNY